MTTKLIGAACLAVGCALAGVASVVEARVLQTAAPMVSLDEDIVTGDWEGTISNDQMPEDIDVLITLELDGDHVTGGFTVQGETADFDGEFDADSNTITGTLTDPENTQEVEAEMTIDGDELVGTITVEAGDMVLVLDINASRVKD